jgi:predicted SprT family Zn-dependent metalloprotease
MGIASLRRKASLGGAVLKTRTIKLSIPLFGRGSYDECVQTVVHEACHLIDEYVNHVRMSHGATWKACMGRAGYPADRCHSVCNKGLTKRFVYTCPNGCKEYRLSTRLHNAIRRGRNRVCSGCNTRVVWTGRREGGC